MFERTQFDDFLRPWVMAATELPDVIMAHPSAPRPQSNYGLLNLIRSSKIGRPVAYGYEDNENTAAVADGSEAPFYEIAIQEYEFTWTLQVYANDALTVANRITPWTHTQAGRELLGPLNMFNVADIQRVPEMVENNWNDRALTEFRVRTYVCTGTSNYQTNTVLLGRVPVDVAESVSVVFNGDPATSLTADKP